MAGAWAYAPALRSSQRPLSRWTGRRSWSPCVPGTPLSHVASVASHGGGRAQRMPPSALPRQHRSPCCTLCSSAKAVPRHRADALAVELRLRYPRRVPAARPGAGARPAGHTGRQPGGRRGRKGCLDRHRVRPITSAAVLAGYVMRQRGPDPGGRLRRRSGRPDGGPLEQAPGPAHAASSCARESERQTFCLTLPATFYRHRHRHRLRFAGPLQLCLIRTTVSGP